MSAHDWLWLVGLIIVGLFFGLMVAVQVLTAQEDTEDHETLRRVYQDANNSAIDSARTCVRISESTLGNESSSSSGGSP